MQVRGYMQGEVKLPNQGPVNISVSLKEHEVWMQRDSKETFCDWRVLVA